MFLTEEDYRIAESNDIPRDVVDERYYYKEWTREKSITKSTKKKPRCSVKGYWKQYQSICEERGIRQQTFYKRIERGMNPERASILPLDTKYYRRSNA